MGYFSALHGMALEAGIDLMVYETPKRKKVKKIKPEEMCDKCSSKATRFFGSKKLCLWCACGPGEPYDYERFLF